MQGSGATHSDELAIANIHCDAERLVADLSDGRRISVPLSWYPRLAHANPEQRANWKLVGRGYGVHWPDVDEDVSLDMLIRGLPSLEARTDNEA